MGRGHSTTRSKSRPVNKEKRARSRSVSGLKQSIAVAKEVGARAASQVVAAPSAQQRDVSRMRAAAAAKAVRAAIEEEEEGEESEDEKERVQQPDVMTKYKLVGKMVDGVLDTVCAACVAGARTLDICALGDKELASQCRNVFRHSKGEDGRGIARGIAYPTTVSVNNVLCNHTPLAERESVTLKKGDVVKVHMAAHVDGFPATAARTILVNAAGEEAPLATPAAAACVSACFYALKALIPQLRPGRVNHDLTRLIEQTVEAFPGVKLVEGVLCNRTKRWIIDASESIITTRILDTEPTQDVAECEIGENEVWTLDIATTDAPTHRMQTADDDESNIFRRNQYDGLLRLEAGERALSTIRRDFQCWAFQARQHAEPLKLRLGLSALKKADMVDTFPVLQAKKQFVTARFSATVAVTKKATSIISGAPVELPSCFATEFGTPSPAVAAAASAPTNDEVEDQRPAKRRRKESGN